MKHKKILSLLAAGLAFFGMTSCSDDNDSNPVLDTAPTTFVLNTPTMTDQYVELSADNTVTLSWSQPDYGFAALATYFVQVGVQQADGSVTWCDDYLETTYTQCIADLNGKEIAQAINQADGFRQIPHSFSHTVIPSFTSCFRSSSLRHFSIYLILRSGSSYFTDSSRMLSA